MGVLVAGFIALSVNLTVTGVPEMAKEIISVIAMGAVAYFLFKKAKA